MVAIEVVVVVEFGRWWCGAERLIRGHLSTIHWATVHWWPRSKRIARVSFAWRQTRWRMWWWRRIIALVRFIIWYLSANHFYCVLCLIWCVSRLFSLFLPKQSIIGGKRRARRLFSFNSKITWTHTAIIFSRLEISSLNFALGCFFIYMLQSFSSLINCDVSSRVKSFCATHLLSLKLKFAFGISPLTMYFSLFDDFQQQQPN